MKFDKLSKNINKSAKRAGRGIAAGRGKTAGRGTKGQGARKSGGVRPGFEGGQMPLYMRIPKLGGFNSHREPTVTVYTSQLNEIKKPNVDNGVLVESGLADNPYQKVKLVVNGDLQKKISVKLQGASSQAIKLIEKSGGKFEKVNRLQRPSKKEKI